MLSICIPVYNGEQFLSRCLESLARQTYRDFEVIVVDDCSPGKDEHGWNCKKICRKTARKTGLDITCLVNRTNRGSMEARRSAVYAASGEYVFCIDVDDQLESRALELLAAKAAETGADIVQCGTRVVFAADAADAAESAGAVSDADAEDIRRAANLLITEEVTGADILNTLLLDSKINYFIWGKLIRYDLFIKALEQIPPMYGVWAEDYLMVFFIAYFAQKYIGIPDELYVYTGDSGISNTRKVTDLKKWEKFCAVTSVFATIFMLADDGAITLTKEQRSAIQKKCDVMVALNIGYLNKCVDPAIRKEARAMLIDYSGEAYINSLEKLYNLSEKE